MKKIGVIMPLYNQDREELTMALRSLSLQIYPNWELVVVIDGAKEGTCKILHELLAWYTDTLPRVTVLNRRENKGIAFTLNQGHDWLKNTGRDFDYVTWVSSDNVYYPQFLYVLAKALDAEPTCSLVYSNFDGFVEGEFVYENTEWREKFPTWDEPRTGRGTYRGSPVEDFGVTSFIGQCFMYQIKDLDDVRYNSDYERAEDYEFFSQLLKKGNLGFVKEFLGAYRYEGGHSYTTLTRPLCKSQIIRVREKILEDLQNGVYEGRKLIEIWKETN